MDRNITIEDTITIRLHTANLKQKDLAEYLGIPATTLNGWLKRGIDIPAKYIIRVAEFLNCTPLYLLTGKITDQIDVNEFREKNQAAVDRQENKHQDLSDDALDLAQIYGQLSRPNGRGHNTGGKRIHHACNQHQNHGA